MNGKSELTDIYIKLNEVRNEGNHELVIEHAEHLLSKALLYSNKESALSAHYICAISYYYTGNFQKVLFHIEQHHEQCVLYGKKSDWMRSYYLQYFISSYASDFDKGQNLLENMLSIALEIEDFSYVSMAYCKLTHLFNTKEQYKTALEYGQLALNFAELKNVNRKILLIRAHLHLAESAIHLKNLEIAMNSIEYLSQLHSMCNYPREIAFFEILKGRLYELMGEPEKAFHFYTIAKEKEEELNDFTLLKDIQQKRIALAENICTFDELAIIQKEYIDLLHDLEDNNLVKTAIELQIRLQSTSVKTSENIDYLTGVYNRKYLEETTNLWLAEASETKKSVVCIVFDIDNLKMINDTYGHLAGDEAIKFVAETCCDEIRKEDVLGRFGGDEFVLVMQDISLENAERKASLLARKIETLSSISSNLPTPVTISVGLGDNLMREVRSFKDLFHLADLALYKAKKNGKNQVVSFV